VHAYLLPFEVSFHESFQVIKSISEGMVQESAGTSTATVAYAIDGPVEITI
jgi:hypothetical protein